MCASRGSLGTVQTTVEGMIRSHWTVSTLLPWSRLPCDVSDDARRGFVRYVLGTRRARELAILCHVLPDTIETWAVAGQWALRARFADEYLTPEHRAELAAELAIERDERAAQAAALRTARELLGREWATLAAGDEYGGDDARERGQRIAILARATAAVFPELRAIAAGAPAPARPFDPSLLSDVELDRYIELERKGTGG